MIVPTVEFPPVTVFTLQVTVVLVLPVTVAVNCCVFVFATVANVGDITTVIGLAVTVTVAEEN